MTKDVELIGLKDLIAMTGISRSKIFVMVKAGTLPAQANLGGRESKWWKTEIFGWLKARRAEHEVSAKK
jgi:prophage regulatory protein